MKKKILSVVLATKNEEKNIGACLKSIKDAADEIIVVDEESNDSTVSIAKKHGAKVFIVKHEEIFHISKQKALDYAKGDWILQLDADERVTKKLADEIKSVIRGRHSEFISETIPKHVWNEKMKLFKKHQKLIEQRKGSLGSQTPEIVAYFIPRVNYFLSKPLRHAGLYPDGVIRLIKKSKAHFPSKSVHELMEIEGKVAWLFNELEHHDSPTMSRYLQRANRYTDLTAKDYKGKNVKVSYWNLFKYSFLIPSSYFLKLFIIHKGFLDGMRGFVWSLFSALHFPIAYFKYWQMSK